MRNAPRQFLALLLITIAFTSSAQNPNIKFGEIKPQDFETKVYKIDSNANAVILSDVGTSVYEGDDRGGFNIIFKRHTRIRILNRNAFDVATISIPMYASNGMEEEVKSLEAVTYNIENGQVRSTKLDKGSIFKDRLSKNYTVRKFTMPDLKEGCIIEIRYTFKSPYERDLRSWVFQNDYPVLWSEYKTEIPTVYEFVFLPQGYHPYAVKTTKLGRQNYTITSRGESASDRTQSFSFTSDVITSTWAMQNVPALKKENFTTTLSNHISKIDFQLSKISYPETPVKHVLNNWYAVSEQLMKDPDFGETLTKNNGWMNSEINPIVAGAKDRVEAAKKIFEFVRDNFTCTNYSRYYLSNPLKKIFQSKSGTVADINLLLTAMLLQQNYDARPVLLSTRDHGKAYEIYPIMDKLNYVITQVKIAGVPYLLDASHNKLGFGKLSTDCYNGYARVIDPWNPVLIDLAADSLKEQKLTTVFIFNDEKEGLKGSFASTLGHQESYGLREKLTKTNQEEYFKDIKKRYSFEVDMSNTSVDSLKKYEDPVAVKYDFKFEANEDIIYLNPLFTEGQSENPFKAAERTYPVEMPYAVNETFILRMDIPKGYQVEEIPKSTRVKFNEDEGIFEYIIANSGGVLQLRSKLQLHKATFEPDDYQALRDFFSYVVKKHSEQVVLKKIKG